MLVATSTRAFTVLWIDTPSASATAPRAGSTTRILGLDPQVFGGIVAAVGLVFLCLQVVVGRKQVRLFELQVRRELAEQWHGLQHCWNVTVSAVRGSEDFYSPADAEARAKVEAYEQALNTERATIQPFRDWQIRRLMAHGDQEAIDRLGPAPYVGLAATNELRLAAKPVEAEIRRLLQQLDDFVRRVIQGGLDIEVLYSVVGVDLVRSTGVIRTLVGRNYADDGIVDTAEQGSRLDPTDLPHDLTQWLTYYPGLRLRLLVLNDLLWAAACRRGDLWFLEVAEVADLKRGKGSGDRNRARLVRVSRAISGGPRAMLQRWRLLWLLTEAEAPRIPVPPEDSSTRDMSAASRRTAVKGFRRFRLRTRLYVSAYRRLLRRRPP